MPPELRVRRIRFSADLVFAMLRGDHPAFRVVADEVPADAKLVNVQHAWPNCIDVLVESETFSPVPEGEEIPFLTPMFEALSVNAH